MKRLLLGLIFFGLLVGNVWARSEVATAKKLCAALQGTSEVQLADKTRADCITLSYVIEVERPYKWAEGIGQVLYYATHFPDRTPVLVFVVSNPMDGRYISRALHVIREYRLPIQIFLTTWDGTKLYSLDDFWSLVKRQQSQSLRRK